jgi:hypothetical protein
MTGRRRQPIALLFPTPTKLGIKPIDVDTSNTNKPKKPEKTKTRTVTSITTSKHKAL